MFLCMPDIPENRRSQRSEVYLTAQCRTQSGLRDMGVIADISSDGCRVRTNGLFFKVGTRVVIRPEGMEGLTGVIRWIKGDYAGVEFDRQIYTPVLEHLVRAHNMVHAPKFPAPKKPGP
jgi:hypothetical protein